MHIDFQKLKREWKTFAVAVVGFILETYDALVVTGMIDLPKLFPDHLQPYVGPTALFLMLVLRKYNNHVQPTTQTL